MNKVIQYLKRLYYLLNNAEKHKETSLVTLMSGTHISPNSFIGDYSYVGFNCFITRASIGRYCSIANNVTIGSGEHDLTRVSTSSKFYENAYRKLTERDCLIGNDVWIGVDAIIRRGVKVGDGAIIGANSFVNKDVPDFAIVVGSPAKIIRYRFLEEERAIIIKSNWWNFEFEEANQIIKKIEAELTSK